MSENPTLEVEIQDTTANKGRRAEIPSNVPITRLIAAMVRQLGLPIVGPDGQRMSYKLYHKNNSMQLNEEQTLAEANVETGAILRLQAEMIAGHRFIYVGN